MSSPFSQNIDAQIDLYVRNDALTPFTNLNLNRILHLINQLADTAAGGATNQGNILPITSANFINTTDCPLASMNGIALRIYYGEAQKFIEQDAGEWQELTGGGFRILIPGFDSTQANYHFYVFEES